MTYQDLISSDMSYGKRIIIEDGKTVRIQCEGPVGNFDGKTIWRYKYISGKRYGEIKETYSTPQTFCAYTPFGKLVPAGRRIDDSTTVYKREVQS